MAIEDFMEKLKQCDRPLALQLVSLDVDDFNEVILSVRYNQPPSDSNLTQIYSQLRRYVDQGKLPATGY